MSRPCMMPGDNFSRRILILDGMPETTEVLQAILEPQGVQVTRQHSRSSPRKLNIDLVIVHGSHSESRSACLELSEDVPRVFVDCEPDIADAAGEFHSPFHYSDLLTSIQQILDRSSQTAFAPA